MTLRNFELEYDHRERVYELNLYINCNDMAYIAKRFNITLPVSAVDGQLLDTLRKLCHDETASFGMTQVYDEKTGRLKSITFTAKDKEEPLLSLKKFF